MNFALPASARESAARPPFPAGNVTYALHYDRAGDGHGDRERSVELTPNGDIVSAWTQRGPVYAKDARRPRVADGVERMGEAFQQFGAAKVKPNADWEGYVDQEAELYRGKFALVKQTNTLRGITEDAWTGTITTAPQPIRDLITAVDHMPGMPIHVNGFGDF